MFYNQDYLLSKQAGLHLAWLASTMSNATASAFKKISKREIISFDVSKTCKEVAQPAQPLALRTSGTLMYGVVRVYTKQADFWINDVQGTYNSIRKSILQNPHAIVKTAGGITVVGQDTSLIDMPNRGRHQRETVTLPCFSELYRAGLCVGDDWIEDDDILGSFQEPSNTFSDSLSMFGSSIYDQSLGRAREGSLGLEFFTPQQQRPYTADPSSILRRGDLRPLHHQNGFENFPLDDLDLPQALGNDIQLDLGLDTANDAAANLGGFDDQAGFDLQDFDNLNQDDQLPPLEEGEIDQRPAKRPRFTVEDRSKEISYDKIKSQNVNYVEKMADLRLKDRGRQMIKEAERLARLNIFGPGINLEGAPMLVNLWTTGLDMRLAQISKSINDGDNLALQGSRIDESVMQFPDDQAEQTLPFQDDEVLFFEGGDQTGTVDGNIHLPRRSSPSWEAEIGRAGTDSQPIEMPWARRSTMMHGIDDTTLAGETTLGFNTRSLEIETPSGIRRAGGRTSALSVSSVGRRLTLDAGGEGEGGGDPEIGFQSIADENIQQDLSSQELAEQESVQFLKYVLATRNELDGGQPLFFSDLAPVADSQPAVAARAFYQVLSLVTGRRLSAKQSEPYAEIEIKVV